MNNCQLKYRLERLVKSSNGRMQGLTRYVPGPCVIRCQLRHRATGEWHRQRSTRRALPPQGRSPAGGKVAPDQAAGFRARGERYRHLKPPCNNTIDRVGGGEKAKCRPACTGGRVEGTAQSAHKTDNCKASTVN